MRVHKVSPGMDVTKPACIKSVLLLGCELDGMHMGGGDICTVFVT